MGSSRPGKKHRDAQNLAQKASDKVLSATKVHKAIKPEAETSKPMHERAAEVLHRFVNVFTRRPGVHRGFVRNAMKKRNWVEQLERDKLKDERKEQIDRIDRGEEPWEGFKTARIMAFQLAEAQRREEAGEEEGGEYDCRGGGESEEEGEDACKESILGGSDLDTDEEDVRHVDQMMSTLTMGMSKVKISK